MSRPRRTHAEARAQMREGILRLGNAQLAESGAAALSVREIARGLGVASSAIYRHVASRDELLTLLLVDAYTDLADAALAEAAPADTVPRGATTDAANAAGASDAEVPTAARLGALARGMRGWAVAHPERWALAYGSPVPGYAAPAEQTTGPGTRVMAAFLGLLAQESKPAPAAPAPAATAPAAPATAVSVPASAVPAPSDALAAELAVGAAELGLEADPSLAAAAVEAWTGLIGLISAEIFGQLGPDLARHGEELMERWIAATANRFGLG